MPSEKVDHFVYKVVTHNDDRIERSSVNFRFLLTSTAGEDISFYHVITINLMGGGGNDKISTLIKFSLLIADCK